MHPSFETLVRILGQSGVKWSLVSNATLINSRAAALLKDNSVYSVSVSLDGDETEHNLLRQGVNAYADALQGVEALRSNGIRIQITTVVTKRTIKQLESMEHTIRALGAVSWKLLNVEPIGRALTERTLLLEREELFRLLDFIRERRASCAARGDPLNITYGCSHFLPLIYEEEVRITPFICGAGILISGIRCNGDISGCLDIEQRPELVQGNIYYDDFWTVWRERYQFFRRGDRTEQSEQCRECGMRTLCGGDSFHTWDFEHKEPRMCLHFLK